MTYVEIFINMINITYIYLIENIEPGATSAADKLHLNKGNLTQCLKKQRYYKTIGGYAWVYKK